MNFTASKNDDQLYAIYEEMRHNFKQCKSLLDAFVFFFDTRSLPINPADNETLILENKLVDLSQLKLIKAE